jgi:hypothetical protein
MKFIAIIVGALLSTAAAHAGEYTHYNRINFQSASTWVPSNKVCQNGGMLYHKTKPYIEVTVCEEGNKDCRTSVRRLEQPMVGSAERCAKWNGDDCVAYETYVLKQGPSAKAEVYASYNDYEDGRSPKSVTKFQLPACE